MLAYAYFSIYKGLSSFCFVHFETPNILYRVTMKVSHEIMRIFSVMNGLLPSNFIYHFDLHRSQLIQRINSNYSSMIIISSCFWNQMHSTPITQPTSHALHRMILCKNHWSLGDPKGISANWFLSWHLWLMAEVSILPLPPDECHWTLVMISQHRFRWWLGAI